MEHEDNARLIQIPEWFRAPRQKFPDLRSVVRQEFDSIVKAEEYAESLGVIARYGVDLSVANCINETLAQLQERNLPLPLSVLIDTRFFERYGIRAELVVAMTANNVIFVNPAGNYWQDPVETALSLYQARFWSTPHPLHSLFHEAGHLAQDMSKQRQKPLTPREAGIANAVGSRAIQDADEFVAETFCGLLFGVVYDADILRMYRRFGGRIP